MERGIQKGKAPAVAIAGTRLKLTGILLGPIGADNPLAHHRGNPPLKARVEEKIR